MVQRNETSHVVMVKDQSNENSDKVITVDSILHKMLCVDYSDSEVKYLCQFPNHQECQQSLTDIDPKPIVDIDLLQSSTHYWLQFLFPS